MSHVASEQSQGFLAQLFARWRERAELNALPAEELGRLAHELGVSGDELTDLAARGPHAADLLYERMQAMGLARSDVDRVAHGLMRDLERSCSCCGDKSECKRDLNAHPDDPVWKEYCPNAMSLEAVRRMKGRAAI
jgi:hypothetical protein